MREPRKGEKWADETGTTWHVSKVTPNDVHVSGPESCRGYNIVDRESFNKWEPKLLHVTPEELSEWCKNIKISTLEEVARICTELSVFWGSEPGGEGESRACSYISDVIRSGCQKAKEEKRNENL